MEKLDLKTELKPLYAAKAGRPSLVTVPALSFLMVDGRGDPNSAQSYGEAVSALYALAYGLKFQSKAAGRDFAVMPLEGLWWSEHPTDFATGRKDRWQWTMMLAQPDWISAEMLKTVRAATQRKKALPGLDLVRLERFEEGPAAQVLHVGPYGAENPTIVALHAFIAEQNLGLCGKHHEIYPSMPGRVAPDKLKTIIRQPVARR